MKEVGHLIRRTALLAVAFFFWFPPTESVSQTQLQSVVGGLTRPVLVTHARDDRIFIVEQAGTVRIFYGGGLLATPFLDIAGLVTTGGNEQGLLGLAFHPNYPATPFIFVHFTSNGNVLPDGTDPNTGENLIVRYNISSDRNVVDQTSAKSLLRIPQPFSNHNGGMIAFGPDNYLYIAKGDGGSANDPFGAAQNINNILGKMLRIDVDQNVNVSPYHGIPPTNPFVGADGRDDVFFIGLRNPWRFSFDRLTGEVWIGDVGQGSLEEINRLAINASAPGKNFGWRIFEGDACTGLDPCNPPANYVAPVLDYLSGGGSPRCSVTGGYVYRGTLNTALIGDYIFGDYCTGEIFRLSQGTDTAFILSGQLISSFGENSRGEVYVAGHGSGQIFKLLPVPASPASINGRVVNSLGRGLADTVVVLRDTANPSPPITTRTNAIGFYTFPNIPLNREYSVNVVSRRSVFPEKRFILTDDFFGVDMVGVP
jgi:glucose/arabinose dehydrogenase